MNKQFGAGMDHHSLTEQAQQQNIFRLVIAKVFIFMLAALLVSAASAYYLFNSSLIYYIAINGRMAIMGIFFAQIIAVMALTASLRRLNIVAGGILFFLYAVLTGITLGLIVAIYTEGSIIMAMISAAVVFGVMAIWGYNTKKDLTGIGALGRMLLIGALIVTLINFILYFFIPEFFSMINMLLNYVFLAIFIGLTAYDMQKIKEMALGIEAGSQTQSGLYEGSHKSQDLDQRAMQSKSINALALMGALMLYLDLINIFIRLLSIFGKKK